MRKFTENDIPDQTGRIIAVTGANAGVGFHVARMLAARGARVLLACRDAARADAAIARIRESQPDADLAFVPLDLADLDNVREAARRIGEEPRLDALVNNAGLMMTPLGRTQQGFELQFGVNHLGTFALTALLLPKLASDDAGRVVVTSSVAHRRAKLDWGNLDAEKGYHRQRAYYASKLANALFMVELDRRLRAAGSPVTAVGCHPGVARTELFRHLPLPGLIDATLGPLLNSASDGALPTLLAATGPIEGGGYYGPRGLREIRGKAATRAWLSPAARDEQSGRRLWDLSVRLTGIDPGLPAAEEGTTP